MGSLRVLQVLGDTDRLAPHLAAIELHSGLAGLGLEVRTLALAPGPVGGLETAIPAMAPGRRSIAARTQMGSERRWADVVVLHGRRALTVATVPGVRSSAPTVLGVWDELPGDTSDRWGSEARIARRSALVVVNDAALVAPATQRYVGVRVEAVPAVPDGDDRRRIDAPRWASLLDEVVA